MSTPSRAFKSAAYGHVADVGKVLSNAVRLELLDLLTNAPRTVEQLANAVEQSVANTSHHLQVLKRAHLVSTTRDGTYIRYAIAGDDVAALVEQLQAVAQAHLAALDKLTSDYFTAKDEVEAVDLETLRQRMRNDDVILVDVRPVEEHAAGAPAGAISIPLAELAERAGELPETGTVVAYCRGPFCSWSADAATMLRRAGRDAVRTEATVHQLQSLLVDATDEGASEA